MRESPAGEHLEYGVAANGALANPNQGAGGNQYLPPTRTATTPDAATDRISPGLHVASALKNIRPLKMSGLLRGFDIWIGAFHIAKNKLRLLPDSMCIDHFFYE